jgi:hypothetical protein
MKLALVYNPLDNKLQPSSYCSVFRGMFDALVTRFETQHVTADCSAADIDADLIFFFDPHSSHHITIDGIRNHPAIKMEYWNDPHQVEVEGMYKSTGLNVHKLGHEQRLRRADARGIDFIVSPVKYAFYRYFKPFWSDADIDKRLLYFPTAPSFEPGKTPLNKRMHEVVANGATWGDEINRGYTFRRWAYKQEYVFPVPHTVKNKKTPKGENYGAYLETFAGALALCDVFPVVKYFEIPMAGCVCFAQFHEEYHELGFNDLQNCIFVNAANFEKRVRHFLEAEDITLYQDIATAGRKLIENNYTAKHFANFIYTKVLERVTA